MNTVKKFFQHFFWSCAGADTEVLDHCESDQKKYFSIGAIIFLVACFAALAMFFAASTIVEQNSVALGIGLLWGTMILMLDRLIVATISNDEHTSNWDRFKMAIPRILLAIIIAIVISQPIEVRLFAKQIEKQILANRAIESLNHFKTLENQAQIGRYENRLELMDEEIKKIEEKAQEEGMVPTALYRHLKEERKNAESRLGIVTKRNKQNDYLAAKQSIKKINDPANANLYKEEKIVEEPTGRGTFINVSKSVFTAEANRLLQQAQAVIDEVDGKIAKARRVLRSLKRELLAEQTRHQDSLLQIAASKSLNLDSTRTKMNLALDDITQQSDAFKKVNNSDSLQQASFFEQLKALNTLGYDYDEFGQKTGRNIIYWANLFIFFLFLLVETSPVLVKIMAPAGAYDEAFEKKKATERQIFQENMNAKIDVAAFLRQQWKKEKMQ